MKHEQDQLENAMSTLRTPQWDRENHMNTLERQLMNNPDQTHSAPHRRRRTGLIVLALLLASGLAGGATYLHLTKAVKYSFIISYQGEAIRLMKESDKPSAEIAAELGIRRNQLYKWNEQLEAKGDDAFSQKRGRPLKENQSELSTLRQENNRLREEVDILKKAAVYFAKELK